MEGQPYALKCENCGSDNTITSNYCYVCGKALCHTVYKPTSKSKPVGAKTGSIIIAICLFVILVIAVSISPSPDASVQAPNSTATNTEKPADIPAANSLHYDYLNGKWGASTTENSVSPNEALSDVYTFHFAKSEHPGVYSGTMHKAGWVVGPAKARLYLNASGHNFKIVWMADGDAMTNYVDIIDANKAVLYTSYSEGPMGEEYIYRKP